MTAEGNLYERLAQLSPKELNVEFRREFYDAPALWRVYSIGSEEKARQLRILTTNFKQFLSFAHITKSCGRRAERIVRLYNIAGTMRDQFCLLFDLDSMEGGGLFARERAKELDRLLYRKLIQRYFGASDLLESQEKGLHRRFREAVHLAGGHDDEELLKN